MGRGGSKRRAKLYGVRLCLGFFSCSAEIPGEYSAMVLSLCNGTRAASSDNWVDSPWNAWACVHRRVLVMVPVGNVVVNWSPILISEVGRGKGGIVL